MAVEIEKKYKLTTDIRERILAVLKKQGAVFEGEDFEVNEIYGGGILDEKKAVLRIRKIEDKTILTFKRRIENNLDYKRQIEHETEIADAAAIKKIIDCLGFQKKIVYEKKRRKWKLKNVEIVLDELPFGLFMEIEGKITDIRLIEILLEAEDFEVVHETYPYLTTKSGKRDGETIEARFEKKS